MGFANLVAKVGPGAEGSEHGGEARQGEQDLGVKGWGWGWG